ncbi:LPXTG cell wall anchor domain-containing protein [Pseudoalteromonas sp. G4]|uniref:LPXTG cell wall anchor domain-containing protein n=1 Tax=Pseudoalteromonas sp. G4 TaxID=2992761 RepID=UPI00237D9002|nr:LPXTG cell wall anchor domain-containing protein [Pseudoalteromonas sp. G4]MDE3271291.1 LPXTG cell wall anchor domain-containing protein [Pseudoalteromonas sp. G4]
MMNRNKLASIVGAGILLSSGAVFANDKQCSDVIYASSVTSEFPEIQQACKGVVERNGESFTKLVAHIGKTDQLGRTRLQLRLDDDKLGKVHRIKPNKNLAVSTHSGEKITWAELAPYQDITVYVPHDRWAFVSIDEEETAPVEEIVIIEEPEELPKTASNQHLPAVLGGLLLLVGGLLTMRRKSN